MRRKVCWTAIQKRTDERVLKNKASEMRSVIVICFLRANVEFAEHVVNVSYAFL